jgi:hypothetical protein
MSLLGCAPVVTLRGGTDFRNVIDSSNDPLPESRLPWLTLWEQYCYIFSHCSACGESYNIPFDKNYFVGGHVVLGSVGDSYLLVPDIPDSVSDIVSDIVSALAPVFASAIFPAFAPVLKGKIDLVKALKLIVQADPPKSAPVSGYDIRTRSDTFSDHIGYICTNRIFLQTCDKALDYARIFTLAPDKSVPCNANNLVGSNRVFIVPLCKMCNSIDSRFHTLREKTKAVQLTAFFFEKDYNELYFSQTIYNFLKVYPSTTEKGKARECYKAYTAECLRNPIANHDYRFII